MASNLQCELPYVEICRRNYIGPCPVDLQAKQWVSVRGRATQQQRYFGRCDTTVCAASVPTKGMHTSIFPALGPVDQGG